MVTEPIQGEIGKRASAASAELEDGWQEYASRIKRAKANTPEDKDIEIQEFDADPADFDESMNDDEELEGAELAEDIDPKLLEAARKEEIAFMVDMDMRERATYEECKLNTGRGPVSTRWVDVDEGRNGSPTSAADWWRETSRCEGTAGSSTCSRRCLRWRRSVCSPGWLWWTAAWGG